MPWYLRLHLPDGAAVVRTLDTGIYSVGLDRENRIALKGRGVSGRHAILSLRETGAWIEDLDTPEGTFLDDAAIAGRLVDMGINSPAAFEGVEADDLVSAGFTAEEAQTIIARVAQK